MPTATEARPRVSGESARLPAPGAGRSAGRTVPLDPEADLPAPEAGDPGDIIAILRSMPETYRTVLELRFLEELDSAEIARRTGLSVSAVDTRIHRGRKRLQEALRKEGYGRG